jgi:hypothetical protein
VPFEENYLDLWLSKPVHRGSYMLAKTLLRDLLIFPTSLLWYPDVAAVYGLPIGLGLIALALGLLIVASTILARQDVA